MAENLVSSLGKNNEESNISLAMALCASGDAAGIKEIALGLQSETKVANDCIQVLTEIGSRKPEYIAGYVGIFAELLSSENKRLVQGALTALSMVSDIRAREVYAHIQAIVRAYYTGNFITANNSITIFSKLCQADKAYEKELFPLLIKHLSTCRAEELPTDAERIATCVHADNYTAFIAALEYRRAQLSGSPLKRVDMLIQRIKKQFIT